LRVVIGSAQLLSAVPETAAPDEGDVLIEAHLRAMVTGEPDAVLEDAFRAGATDAWFVPVVSRDDGSGGILSMLSPPDRLEPLLRLARDRADGGLVRVESVRRAE
jgi:uncharacterized protein (DUF111 family)